MNYALIALAVLIVSGVGYQTLIAPKRWMKKYGNGVYSPERQLYSKVCPVPRKFKN